MKIYEDMYLLLVSVYQYLDQYTKTKVLEE